MTQPDLTTFQYYEQNAQDFARQTVNARMDDALAAFVRMLPSPSAAAASSTAETSDAAPAPRILDWGCGSGRDSAALRAAGFNVISVDASPAMAQAALEQTNTVVHVQRFDQLDETDAYDGIWACASLLHVRPEDLPATLARAHAALKPNGVLFCSFKLGDTVGLRNGRWFTYLQPDQLAELLAPHFDIARIWTSQDVRPGRGDEQWVSCLATKR